jgi:hypothetical protein
MKINNIGFVLLVIIYINLRLKRVRFGVRRKRMTERKMKNTYFDYYKIN